MSEPKEIKSSGLVSAADWLRQHVKEPAVNARDAVNNALEQNPVYSTAASLLSSPGASPLKAFVRQGADELAQVLSAFPDGVQPVPEPGLAFEPTQAMMTEEITGRKVHSAADLLVPQQQPERQQSNEGRSM